jgi:creatinine amidohydrolase
VTARRAADTGALDTADPARLGTADPAGVSPTELAGLSTVDLATPSSVLLLPVGATEQHGPHLPLATDTLLVAALARAAAVRLAGTVDVLVAPALAYGASGEHAGFPGTLSMGTDALEVVLVELVRSVGNTARLVVLVNGHGGNEEAVARAVARLRREGRGVTSWSPRIPDGDAHAGRTETSLLLAVRPDLVELSRAEAGATAPLAELWPSLRSGGVAAVSPNGVLGDPAGASAEEGEELLGRLVAELAAAVLAGVPDALLVGVPTAVLDDVHDAAADARDADARGAAADVHDAAADARDAAADAWDADARARRAEPAPGATPPAARG